MTVLGTDVSSKNVAAYRVAAREARLDGVPKTLRTMVEALAGFSSLERAGASTPEQASAPLLLVRFHMTDPDIPAREPEPSNQERDTLQRQYRTQLVEAELASQTAFDRTLLTLSGGPGSRPAPGGVSVIPLATILRI